VWCLALTPQGYLGLGSGGNRPFGFHLWERPVEWDETPHEAVRILASAMWGKTMAWDDAVEVGMRMRHEQERVFTFIVAVQPDAMRRVARGVQWLSPAYLRAAMLWDSLFPPEVQTHAQVVLDGVARWERWAQPI
jgi:hypothetical protein